MTTPPPNVFDSGEPVAPSPDEAAASFRHTSGAAADIPVSPGVLLSSLPSGESEPSVTSAYASGESCGEADGDARKPLSMASRLTPPGPQESIDCIGEIFIGAAKLEPVEMWFENTAYPREDELLYEVLLAMDNTHAPDLIEMPYGMEGIFDPPPLFLQQMRA